VRFEAVAFLKKSSAKNYFNLGHWRLRIPAQVSGSFLRRFFSKKRLLL